MASVAWWRLSLALVLLGAGCQLSGSAATVNLAVEELSPQEFSEVAEGHTLSAEVVDNLTVGTETSIAKAGATKAVKKAVKKVLKKAKKKAKGKKAQTKTNMSSLKKRLAKARKKTKAAKMAAQKALHTDKSLKRMYKKRIKKLRRKNAAKRKIKQTKSATKASLKLKALERKGRKMSKKTQGMAVKLKLLKKSKLTADDVYAKLKRKHAMRGVGLKLSKRRKHGMSHFSKAFGRPEMVALRHAAAVKNKIDQKYKKAVALQIHRLGRVGKIETSLRKGSIPSAHLIRKAHRREQRALHQENKLTKLRRKSLAMVAKADAKAQKSIRKEVKLADRVHKTRERVAKKTRRVHKALERTKKSKLKSSEKTSKVMSIKAQTNKIKQQSEESEAGFQLSNKARRIRAFKAAKEAANKKRTTLTHTLRVMKSIDAAAKKQARILTRYKANQKVEQSTIKKGLERGQKKLARAQSALRSATSQHH